MRILTIALLLLLLLPSLNGQDGLSIKSFKYIGHRGASYLAPENTLASMKLAWELGADGAECDVMLTSDHEVILFHDNNTKKLTGQDLVVRETTWEELKPLAVLPGESNLPEFSQETIPLLEHVLEALPGDRLLVIEIKTGPEILPYLQKVIEKHWKRGEISFIAFDFETIKQAKQLYPEVPCYYLASFKPDLNRHFDAVVEAGLDGVDLRHNMIDGELAERCHESGLDVWCWTVNDPETALKMKQLRVSAVTTDRPAWLKNNLEANN